jgi:hypothetical protein
MLTAMGAVGIVAKKLFTNAVREQMAEMHEENRKRLLEVSNRMSTVENTLARIDGRMQERWGDYQEEK